jgi:nucleoside-triphosphatase
LPRTSARNARKNRDSPYFSHLLITGAPGSGKSTAVRRVAERLGASISGFYTEEMRTRGERRGFQLVAYDGTEAVTAHVDFPKTIRVSRYGVDVAAIDRAAEAALARRPGVEVYLVDEIGKMECFSERFVERMRVALDSGVPVIATVAQRGAGFIAKVKARRDCELWKLTRANRDAMPDEILDWLAKRRRARRS